MAFIIYLIVLVAVYCFTAYCLQNIAKNTGTPNDIWAWIPILNFYLLVQIVQKDILWFILLLIPCVNIVAMIIIFMDLAEVCGRERWYGLLLFVPILNFYILWQLAFA